MLRLPELYGTYLAVEERRVVELMVAESARRFHRSVGFDAEYLPFGLEFQPRRRFPMVTVRPKDRLACSPVRRYPFRS